MDAGNMTTHGGVFTNSPLLFASSKHSVCIQVAVTALAICVCTRILSSHWYKSVKYGNTSNTEPPTLPYWLPFLRHALSMAWDSPRFTARCLKQYGDGTPFFIDAAGERLLILLDPSQIKQVLNASQALDPNPFIHEKILGQMLASPKEAIDFHRNDSGQLHHIQTDHIRQHVTGTSLIFMSKKVFERLSLNMAEFYASTRTSEWADIPDLFDFIQYQLTRAITETLAGTSITKDYPEMFADQWSFMDKAVEWVMGLPRPLMPAAYAARDRLLANLKRWNAKSESLRIERTANTQWDATAGSGLLQERQKLYAHTPGHDEDAIASQMLGLLVAGNSITPSVSFWFLFEALKDPAVFEQVSHEIQTHRDAETNTFDFAQLTVRPILQSLHAETTRYYASNLSVRVVTTPTFAMDAKYTITKGTTLFIYNKFTGLYTSAWTDARPQSTTKPLDTFWAERFLISDRDGKRARYSDAGLTGCWTSFGGGEHKCPGRHFARNIGIVLLTVILGEYECELRDPEVAQNVCPAVKETAFGKVVPTKKVAARIRRRVK